MIGVGAGTTAGVGATAQADRLEWQKTRSRVLQLLLSGPRRGMPAWGTNGLAEHLPGRQKAHLLGVLWALETEGAVTATAKTYRGRGAIYWGISTSVEDPLSLIQQRRPQRRDEMGRFTSESDAEKPTQA